MLVLITDMDILLMTIKFEGSLAKQDQKHPAWFMNRTLLHKLEKICAIYLSALFIQQQTFDFFQVVRDPEHCLIGNLANHFTRLDVFDLDHGSVSRFVN